METNVNKAILIAYKYAKEGYIAFSDEWKDMTTKDFVEITKDCTRYVAKREKAAKLNCSLNQHGGITVADCFNGIDRTLEVSFRDYNDCKKNIAKSIIGYNSEKFIKYLKDCDINYDEIRRFISIINFIKEKPDKCLSLLVINSDLMTEFYQFAAYNIHCLQYGDYASIINKLEQVYVFENQKLQKGLSSSKYKAK